jgi:hypothetical protein
MGEKLDRFTFESFITIIAFFFFNVYVFCLYVLFLPLGIISLLKSTMATSTL